MDYLDIFSKSDDLFNIFFEAYRFSDEDNKISLFKLYYSWMHYVSKEILDNLRNKLGLNKLKEKLLRERPEIIEKYDKYNEEIEKKRKEILIQELEQQRLQQNFFGNATSNNNNNNSYNNLNYNQTSNLDNNYNFGSNDNNNINYPSNINSNQNLKTNNLNANLINANKNVNINSLNKNIPQNLQGKNLGNINGNINISNSIPSNINANQNSLTNKTNLNQSLLPSITSSKDKNKEADHLFSSCSSNSSDDEKNQNFKKKRKQKTLENEKELKAMKDIPIKKRKIEDMHSDISSTPDINLGVNIPNRNFSMGNSINNPNQINFGNQQMNLNSVNYSNLPYSQGILQSHQQLQANNNLVNSTGINVNNQNFALANNQGNIPANIFPFNQQMIYAQGNISNIQAQIGNAPNFNYMGQPIPNIQNLNQINLGRPNGFPGMNQINMPMSAQPGNLFIPGAQNMVNLLNAQQGNLIPRADIYKNFGMIDNVLAANNFGIQIGNQNNMPFSSADGLQAIQNANLSGSGITYLNSFISKSNINLDEKAPFFSALAKWYHESLSEDNPLNEVKKDNKKIRNLFDLLKIKDFSEKESYKDLFKKVHNALYSDIKNICSICGFRTSQYKRFVEHLDIHFHMNYMKKNCQKRDMYRREACSKNSWITNTDNNLNLVHTNNLHINKNENLNQISTLNAVLYYLNDSEIHLNANKNNLNIGESESNENMIFPVQDKDLQCIYCKEEFKKKYLTKYHFWFYINVNKLNYEELKMLNQNFTGPANDFLSGNAKNLSNFDDENAEIILIHNTCLEEFVNLILLNNKKNIEQMYTKVN